MAGPTTICRFLKGSCHRSVITSGGRQVKVSTKNSTVVSPIQKLGMARNRVMSRRTA